MATNDFIIDLVEKLKEDNIEYLVVYLQKGKDDSHANAYYDIHTNEGAEMIAVTVDQVYDDLSEEYAAFGQSVNGTIFEEDVDDLEDPEEDEDSK
tara:strand:- start:606 stop:890 length:285 start_codon:yes stop_codon:yes gene_type:complete